MELKPKLLVCLLSRVALYLAYPSRIPRVSISHPPRVAMSHMRRKTSHRALCLRFGIRKRCRATLVLLFLPPCFGSRALACSYQLGLASFHSPRPRPSFPATHSIIRCLLPLCIHFASPVFLFHYQPPLSTSLPRESRGARAVGGVR